MKNRNALNFVFCVLLCTVFFTDYAVYRDVFTVYWGITALATVCLSVYEVLRDMEKV